MKKNKIFKAVSLFLVIFMIGMTWLYGEIRVNAADIQEESIDEHELSLAEYRDILITQEGFSEKEADAKIAAHTMRRSPTVKLYSVTKTKSKVISGEFKLRCQVTVYVWRDVSYGNVEIDHATTPYLGLDGPVIDSDFRSTPQATNTTNKLTVDYNGQLFFTVTQGVSVGFGSISASTSSTTTYSHWVSGNFIWNLSEI